MATLVVLNWLIITFLTFYRVKQEKEVLTPLTKTHFLVQSSSLHPSSAFLNKELVMIRERFDSGTFYELCGILNKEYDGAILNGLSPSEARESALGFFEGLVDNFIVGWLDGKVNEEDAALCK